MVDSLHGSRKFRPFVATMLMAWLNEDGQMQFEWQVYSTHAALFATDAGIRVEAVPDDIRIRQTFERQHAQLVKDNINAMYAWAEKPLQGSTVSSPAMRFF